MGIPDRDAAQIMGRPWLDIVPLGAKLKRGTVGGVQMRDGERYYFITGAGVIGYLPADLIEKEYAEERQESA